MSIHYFEDPDLGAVCLAIKRQSEETPPPVRLVQLSGMIELCEHLAAAQMGLPGILFGYLHCEANRLRAMR